MLTDIQHNGTSIVSNVLVADSFWIRLSGYMFRNKPQVPGILFEPAGSLQTTFMKFDLDIVFLSEDNQIVKISRSVRPWRFIWSPSRAAKVVEVPVGAIPATLKIGDTLSFVKKSHP